MRLLGYPLCAAMLTAAGTASGADLRVEISNAETADGAVYFALYDSEPRFKEHDGIRLAVAKQWTSRPSVAFTDLPPGRYAVAVFQDINGNGELDTNLLGIPTEPFGFSRDATGNMGPPSFDDAAISLGEQSETLVIELRK
ncbi:hypothetical protein CAI21_20625 [Alkalilimnicola ehrlichii]|uniref:DUF2141 domain-containing protein n=1 Tax=Alkalilimnicola ehrlichii TaxID=351052 RepID=A0A3E0WIV2_9GAMM|nr:DUF2141 domain-containing protein [Alkalilimnicola ehrlichii]RFA24696.1 hypothetical protein CAI21_20625 [Alkalilimnicola ehrlichii]RFA31795.1 hypothetical protein CAL65_21390 [Alkalilimnicola ehrlichii]